MTDLYEKLCVVRTAVLNSIGEMTLTGKIVNYSNILAEISEGMGSYIIFMDEIIKLNVDDLLDLGFGYVDAESHLLLLPIWLYAFVPDDTILHAVDGEVFVVGHDEFEIYSNNWVNAGIILS